MAFALDWGGCIVMAKSDKNGASREGSGAFAQMAEAAYHLGLCPIPCSGENGKIPSVTKFNTWKNRPQISSISKFAAKWPYANLGILARLSKIVVVDIDSADLALAEHIERRFGQSPLRSRTGSGHFHLWYRDPDGQPSCNLRTSEGVPVEIIAGNHIVIVPPSWNFATGGSYTVPPFI